MEAKVDENEAVVKNLLDIVSRQHEAFKFQTGTFIDTLYGSHSNSKVVQRVKANLNEIFIFSCKISSLLDDAKQISGSSKAHEQCSRDSLVSTSEDNKGIEINVKVVMEPDKSSGNNLGTENGEKSVETNRKQELGPDPRENDNDLFFDDETDGKKESSLVFDNCFELDPNVKSRGFEYDVFKTIATAEGTRQELPSNVDLLVQLDLDRLNTLFFNHQNSIFEEKLTPVSLCPVPQTFNPEQAEKNYFRKIISLPRIETLSPQLKLETKLEPKPQIQRKKRLKKEDYTKRLRGPYMICNLTTKIDAVRLAKATTVKFAAQKFSLPEKNIKRWMNNGPQRKKGAGRKTMDPGMEVMLLQWMRKYYRTHRSLPDSRDIKVEAKRISKFNEFKASKGWCDKFLRRNTMFFENLKEEFRCNRA